MMAKRCGARSVYACEMNDAMVKMSCDILAANGLADDVTVLHSISTMLSVPENIPSRYECLSHTLTNWCMYIKVNDVSAE